jgi:hypothetical protein
MILFYKKDSKTAIMSRIELNSMFIYSTVESWNSLSLIVIDREWPINWLTVTKFVFLDSFFETKQKFNKYNK